jgi:hypothetical protein
MSEHHTILGGQVHVYKRPDSNLWQCSSYFAGKNRRTSTKEESISKAKEIAEDGIYNFAENSAPERSRAKRPLARYPNTFCVSTTS